MVNGLVRGECLLQAGGLSRALCSVGVLLTVALAGMPGAEAQGYQGTQDAQAACTPDVFRLCSQFIPNRDPIVACLIRSRPHLSPACRAVFKGPVRLARGKAVKSRKVRRARKAG